MTSPVLSPLLELLKGLGIQPHHLAGVSGEEEALFAVLQELIRLRQEGHAAASLRLAEAALETSLPQGWIQDNRARALVDLGRIEEAAEIWQSLRASTEPALATSAARMMDHLIEIQEQHHQSASQPGGPIGADGAVVQPMASVYHDGTRLLRWRKHQFNSPPRSRNTLETWLRESEIPLTDQSSLTTHLFPAIREAIRLRESDLPQESRAFLVDLACLVPYSCWIEDNLARLDVQEEDFLAATGHWQNIIRHSGDSQAVAEAAEMIALYDNKATRQCAHRQHYHVFLDRDFFTRQLASAQISNQSQQIGSPEPAALDDRELIHAYERGEFGDEISPHPDFFPSIHCDCHGTSAQHGFRRYVSAALEHARTFVESLETNPPLELMKRRCLGAFDAKFYFLQRPDLNEEQISPLEHYLLFGWREGTDPSPEFCTRRYLEAHPELEPAGLPPLYHYCSLPEGHPRRIAYPSLRLNQHDIPSGRPLPQADRKDQQATSLAVASHSSSAYVPEHLFNQARCDDQSLKVSFVIPDYRKGGGGHMNIFRMVRYLELQGHSVTVWVINPDYNYHGHDLADGVIRHYQQIQAPVLPLTSHFTYETGHCLVATGWQTVASVVNHPGFLARYYFVQDYEPFFYPRGYDSLQAEETYRKGLACICNSPWLSLRMSESYGAWARHFYQAFDPDAYFVESDMTCQVIESSLAVSSADRRHIAVYSRTHTARRAVELAFAALQRLANLRTDFIVHFFGDPNLQITPSYPAVDHGVLDAHQLGELYRKCSLGLTFSATNYSLIPQEMMACGLPVVDLDSDSTQAIYPEGVISLAAPDPDAVARTLCDLLDDEPRRLDQRNRALVWVSQFSWDKAGQEFERALRDYLLAESDRGERSNAPSQRLEIRNHRRHRAAVMIPTFNGGSLFQDVLEMVRRQRTPWSYQVIVIDSSSTDGTAEFLAAQVGISLHTIPAQQFQHGATRNLGVQLSDADFVAFLTQDALPAAETWLYDLVSLLERYPKAAGAFGRHIAHEGASPYIRRELDFHFKSFEKLPIEISAATDPGKFCANDPGWRQILHFYSDNNSCLRRSVWDQVPYPCVPFGEDQLWADSIIHRGFSKVYASSAVVRHSHDYDEIETFERARTEAEFFHRCFGYRVLKDVADIERGISHCNHNDYKLGMSLNLEPDVISRRLLQNRAKHHGWAAGLGIG